MRYKCINMRLFVNLAEKQKMKGVVYMYVNNHIYDFLMTEYNSSDGTITLDTKDKFMEDLKYILQCEPVYVPPVDKKKFPYRLTILVPFFKINKQTRVNVLYRNYLPPNMQNMVRNHFNKLFKLRAHAFILGACRNGSKQSDAIRDFFETFGINENPAIYEMLKKSWDRSKEKLMFLQHISNYC